jgi:hypothetical protein
MARTSTVRVSSNAYKVFDALRQKVPGKNRIETFSEMFDRLLPEFKKVSS